MLANQTLWSGMSIQFKVPNLLSTVGLFKYYVLRDLVKLYNHNGRRQVETFFVEQAGLVTKMPDPKL